MKPSLNRREARECEAPSMTLFNAFDWTTCGVASAVRSRLRSPHPSNGGVSFFLFALAHHLMSFTFDIVVIIVFGGVAVLPFSPKNLLLPVNVRVKRRCMSIKASTLGLVWWPSMGFMHPNSLIINGCVD